MNLIKSHYEERFYKKDGTYKSAPVSYNSTFYQGKTKKDNKLKGNEYVGDSYGSGDKSHIRYEVFGNVSFR